MAVLDASVESKALAAKKTLTEMGVVRAAYVFGSHTEERADRWSDIDVAAFMEGIENWGLQRRALAAAQVMREVGFDVETHLFPASSLEHAEPGSLAAHVLRHGVRVW